MTCKRCRKTYPSQYYFFKEGKASRLICTECFEKLTPEEQQKIREKPVAEFVDAHDDPTEIARREKRVVMGLLIIDVFLWFIGFTFSDPRLFKGGTGDDLGDTLFNPVVWFFFMKGYSPDHIYLIKREVGALVGIGRLLGAAGL